MSASDIEPGRSWGKEISEVLNNSSFGIICLTRDNINAPWIHFEAGALSKTLHESLVCPYLLDLIPTDIKGPLAQFQATVATLSDTRALVGAINRALGTRARPEEQLSRVFDICWPNLRDKLTSVPSPSNGEDAPVRTDRDLLEEVLSLVRQGSTGVVQPEVAYQKPAQDEIAPALTRIIEASSAVERIQQRAQQQLDESDELKRNIRLAGIYRIYPERGEAFSAFLAFIAEEQSEIVIVGSSLRGLLQEEGKEYREIRELLKERRSDVRLRFLLTHPKVADLRAVQESRREMEIGSEVLCSVKILKNEWGLADECIKLYQGPPTCFGIKTDRAMLLNVYPYMKEAYASPCLIALKEGYVYSAFNSSHFNAWTSRFAQQIPPDINALEAQLPAFAKAVDVFLSSDRGGQLA